MKRELYLAICKWIEVGHELNKGLVILCENADGNPLEHINTLLKNADSDILITPEFVDEYKDDPVAIDDIMYRISSEIIPQHITRIYQAHQRDGEEPLKAGVRGEHFCDLVVGTKDDRSSWHVMEDLLNLANVEEITMSNLARYDQTLYKERGRIRRKKIKKDENGHPLPFGIVYVYRDPSTKFYGTYKK